MRLVGRKIITDHTVSTAITIMPEATKRLCANTLDLIYSLGLTCHSSSIISFLSLAVKTVWKWPKHQLMARPSTSEAFRWKHFIHHATHKTAYAIFFKMEISVPSSRAIHYSLAVAVDSLRELPKKCTKHWTGLSRNCQTILRSMYVQKERIRLCVTD